MESADIPPQMITENLNIKFWDISLTSLLIDNIDGDYCSTAALLIYKWLQSTKNEIVQF